MQQNVADKKVRVLSIDKYDIAALLIVYLSLILHIFVILKFFVGNGNTIDLLYFVIITVFAPPLVAGAFIFIESKESIKSAFINSASMVVILASLTFVVISIMQWVFSLRAESWQPILLNTLTLITLVHVVFLSFLPNDAVFAKVIDFGRKFLIKRDIKFTLNVFTVLSITLIGLLLGSQINGNLPFFGSLYDLFSGLAPAPGVVFTLTMMVVGPAIVIIAITLARSNASMVSLAKNNRFSLWFTMVAVVFVYLDVRFNSDVLHFLTNAGPANQMIRADGVPLVDTYSQYGLGPLLMTWIAFLIAGPNLHSANLMAQLHSLAFYICILICMYRTTHQKRAALLLGFFSISILLSGWWYGNHSLNSVPSSIGMRYLPCALIVLAISLMKDNQRASWLLVGLMVIGMLWSSEIFIASVAIVSLFIALEFFRSPSVRALLQSIFWCILLPFALAAILACTMTLAARSQLPNATPVFEFLKVYNMTSEFWSIAASGLFFGWVAVAGIVGATLSSAWYLALGVHFNRDQGNTTFCETEDSLRLNFTVAIRRCAPMAGLAIVMSSYYVGRSVDFTLIIAFLPCAALFIPVFLALVSTGSKEDKPGLVLSGLLASLYAIILIFALLAVFRAGGPYRTFASEIIQGNLEKVQMRFTSKPMLEASANPNFLDLSGLAEEALRAIELRAADQERVVLLLGQHPTTPWSVHSDMVLLLAGKGNRLPISYVLSDELSPSRVEQILGHDLKSLLGKVIFVRSDENALGPLETKILGKIRSKYQLKRQFFAGSLITIFSVEKLPK